MPDTLSVLWNDVPAGAVAAGHRLQRELGNFTARRAAEHETAENKARFGLRNRRVLIVEDEYLLAMDLQRYFRNMGAIVLGPVATIDMAHEQVPFADAAVLDVDLNGERVFPVADGLAGRGVPFVFFTGRSDIALPVRFRNTALLAKPFDWANVLNALYPLTVSSPDTVQPETVMSVLPKLRLAARILLPDSGAADRLVEQTLEQAIKHIDLKHLDDDLEAWLGGLMDKICRRAGPDFLQ